MGALRDEMHATGLPLVECSAVASLAFASGVSLDTFVRKHSLLPFHRTVSQTDTDVTHGDLSRLELIEHFGMRVWRQSMAMYCLDCVKEDIASNSFSYWRRSHQLPGVFWCLKHKCQLFNSKIGNRTFDHMPHLEMDGCHIFSEAEFSEVLANPVIQRYVDIMLAVLDAERPTPFIQASFRMSELLKRHQLRIGKKGQQMTLTEKILEQVPMHWLRMIYPDISRRSTGEYFNPIDNLALGPAADQSYILALAVLFDSSDEALDYWYDDIEVMFVGGESQWKSSSCIWKNDKLVKLLIQHNENHRSLSQALGVDATHVQHVMTAAGVPALALENMYLACKAIIDFQKGMSLQSACEANGANLDEVEMLVRIGIIKLTTTLEGNT